MSTDREPTEILDAAIAVALGRGLPCTGWHIQREADGYCAWLYVDSDDGVYSESLFPGSAIEVCETLHAAAVQCLDLAGRAMLGTVDEGDVN